MSAKPLTNPALDALDYAISRDGEWPERVRYGLREARDAVVALDATRAKLAAAVEALRGIEWAGSSGYTGEIAVCPKCLSEHNHKPDCTIGNVLASLSDAAKARDREIEARGLERGAEVAEATIPRAHTYASENADIYRAQDDARDRIAAALRAEAKEVRRG